MILRSTPHINKEMKKLFERIYQEIHEPSEGTLIDCSIWYWKCCPNGKLDKRFNMGADLQVAAIRMERRIGKPR